MNATLGLQNIQLSYRTGFTLDVARLDVPAGQTLAVLGPSGSGKSTLLAILGLLERPGAGSVVLDGRLVTHRDHAARRKMAAVFQRPYLFKGTVAVNVAYGLRMRHTPAEETRSRVAEALERVGLAGYANRSALTLSGGEAQRVALARALVLRPEVLLLDEPLASLDPLLKRTLASEFARILAETRTTTVYVTHDHDEALVVANRIAIMRAGRIVAEGTADEVVGLPADAWTASFLGIESPSRGRVRSCEQGLAVVDCGDGVEIAVVAEARVGDEVLVGVRPEDVVLIAGDAEMPISSARNRIPGVVVDIARRGATWYVTIQAGPVRLGSTVSRAARDELGLEAGARVVAVFKASASHMRPMQVEWGTLLEVPDET